MDVCQGLPPGSLEGWYLQEAASPPSLPPASFFLSYGEGATVGPPGGPEAQLEPELLAYGENAENEEQLPETNVLQVRHPGGRKWLAIHSLASLGAAPLPPPRNPPASCSGHVGKPRQSPMGGGQALVEPQQCREAALVLLLPESLGCQREQHRAGPLLLCSGPCHAGSPIPCSPAAPLTPKGCAP